MKATAERFWAKVDKSGDCWLWTGKKGRKGYGRFTVGNREIGAHRFALQERLGRELQLDEFACHECDTPACVRGDHLFAGSALDNARDAVSKGRHQASRNRGKTHCKNGHPYTSENTRTTRVGYRVCRMCRAKWNRTQRGAHPRIQPPAWRHKPREYSPL